MTRPWSPHLHDDRQIGDWFGDIGLHNSSPLGLGKFAFSFDQRLKSVSQLELKHLTFLTKAEKAGSAAGQNGPAGSEQSRAV